MAKVGEAYVDIRARLNRLKSDLRKGRTVFKKAMKAMVLRARAFATAVRAAMSKARMAILALAAGMAGLIALTAKQEFAEAKLAAAMKAAGFAAGFTTKQMMEMANALQILTGESDEAIMSAQAVLSTFVNIRGRQFVETMEALIDMKTLFDTDMKQAAIQLGKALNDPIQGMSALSRVGVSFTNIEKETIRQMMAMNKVVETQTFMLDILRKQGIEGIAEALNKTLGGQLRMAKNLLGDLVQEIGKAILGGADFADMFGRIKAAIKWVTDNSDLVKDTFWKVAKLIAAVVLEIATTIWELIKALVALIDKLGGVEKAAKAIKGVVDIGLFGPGSGGRLQPGQYRSSRDVNTEMPSLDSDDPMDRAMAKINQESMERATGLEGMGKAGGMLKEIGSTLAKIWHDANKEAEDTLDNLGKVGDEASKLAARLVPLKDEDVLGFKQMSKSIIKDFFGATGNKDMARFIELQDAVNKQMAAIDDWEMKLKNAGEFTGLWADKLDTLRDALLATADAERKTLQGTKEFQTVAATYEQKVSGIVGQVSVDHRFQSQGMKQASTERTAINMLAVMTDIKTLLEQASAAQPDVAYG